MGVRARDSSICRPVATLFFIVYNCKCSSASGQRLQVGAARLRNPISGLEHNKSDRNRYPFPPGFPPVPQSVSDRDFGLGLNG